MKNKDRVEITFKKDVLSLIKDLTVISNSVVLNKSEDSIIISQGNSCESLGFILKTPLNSFSFTGEKVAFYDFREFYQLLDVFQNPTLVEDGRHIIMSDQTTKINYLLSEEDTIECGPTNIDFGSPDASIDIDSSVLNDIRKMLNAMFAQSNQAVPIRCKITVKKKKVIMTFYKEEFDNSFERTFECDSSKDFEYIASAEMFTDVPKGSYTIDFLEIGMTRLTLKTDAAKVEIFTGEIQ